MPVTSHAQAQKILAEQAAKKTQSVVKEAEKPAESKEEPKKGEGKS